MSRASVSMWTDPVQMLAPADFTVRLTTQSPTLADTSPFPPERVARHTAPAAGASVSASPSQYTAHEASSPRVRIRLIDSSMAHSRWQSLDVYQTVPATFRVPLRRTRRNAPDGVSSSP